MRLQPYDDVIKNLNVVNNAAFMANYYKERLSGLFVPITHCNGYTNSFYAAQGICVPAPLSANDLYDWFLGKVFPGIPSAVDCGWRSPIEEAAVFAILKNGGHVVSVFKDPGGHGHIAPIVDPPTNDPYHLYISQAGGTNLAKAPIGKGYGNLKYLLIPHN